MIGEDELSRSGTPHPPAESDVRAEKSKIDAGADNVSDGQEGSPPTAPTSMKLPNDVRDKLKKLEKLEPRYHELLRSYRIAHARIQAIEPFETTLREHTPLTSISDPGALVEYLNQVNIKGDMVLDELKRVTSDRDDYKRKLEEAEGSTRQAWDEVTKLKRTKGSEYNHEQVNRSRAEDEKETQNLVDGDPLGPDEKSPPAAVQSPTHSLRGLSLFSPKLKSMESPKCRQGSEDLFSYDSEIPRLESEVKEKQDEIDSLTRGVETLKGDLAVTRESTQSMVQTLEESTREVSVLRDSRDRYDREVKQQQNALERVLENLRGELRSSEKKLEIAQAERSFRDDRIEDLGRQLQDTRMELDELKQTSSQTHNERKKVDELQKLSVDLQGKIEEVSDRNAELDSELENASKLLGVSQGRVKELESRLADTVSGDTNLQEADKQMTLQEPSQGTARHTIAVLDGSPTAKRKRTKKKKQPGKQISEEKEATPDTKKAPPMAGQLTDDASTVSLEKLREEHEKAKDLLGEKDAAIERLFRKQKDQEGLQEEIETLREDLLHVGQEHVDTKKKAKELMMEKEALEKRIVAQEQEISAMQASETSRIASENRHKDLAEQFEGLKIKATTLQTDLLAAQQLASSRYKDLNDLRSVLQKAQPEIDKLRSEATEMKNVKDALGKKEAEFKRLDYRHEEMRSELAGLKQEIASKESEITSLGKRVSQEVSGRLKAEETNSKATQELHRLETERRQATDSLDRLSKELAKSKEDLMSSKTRVRDIEQQLRKHRSESAGFKEDVELKAAQYASAQSLMASMRDQTAEMAIQMKEAQERCESLDEEVAEAHRLLSERKREGETMRRLLADVEGGADARVREMKDRMDTAIEERDRAEDEASTAGRRRARELEELRNKYRDVERNLKRVEEDKEELHSAQRDWKRRREEFESQVEDSKSEVEQVRKAMGQLRDALDESEKQARESEKQKSELRRSLEETQTRLEKLQKSNKVRFNLAASDGELFADRS